MHNFYTNTFTNKQQQQQKKKKRVGILKTNEEKNITEMKM